MILRTQLTPVFDANDIDVVLQGHDHTYSPFQNALWVTDRLMVKYEFSLNADGTDYDWDHATNVDTQEQIALAPEEGDTDAQAALDAFHEDNNCYTIEDVDGDTVTDPQGILYMTANSASGSKYYELLSTQQDYVAACSQNWLPSYSVITLTADTFAIDTYQITDDGKAEAMMNTFTIKRLVQTQLMLLQILQTVPQMIQTLLQTPQTVLQTQQKLQIHPQMQQLKLLRIKIIFRK